MSSPFAVADSLLAIDVGTVTTRAVLFDVVDGQYRYLAAGTSPTTAGAPYHNVSEGIRNALDSLQKITGRVVIGPDESLIMPSTSDGTGVDSFAASISAGAPLKIVVMGLLEDVTVDSARRLAATIYGNVDQVISLNDRLNPEARIDAIIRLRPDLIIVAGGTENGATQSVLKLLETVGLACYLLPKEQHPEILYVGNSALKREIKASLEGLAELHFSSNVRPSLDVEQLEAAQLEIAQVFGRIRSKNFPGVDELNLWSRGKLVPTSAAFGRVIKFLSRIHASQKGVLGIDVGASATVVAMAMGGSLSLNVFTQLGLARDSTHWHDSSLAEIRRWIPQVISTEVILEYIYNKSIYPVSLPATVEEMAIEHALVRQALQQAIRKAGSNFPGGLSAPGEGLLPWVEPIVASGSCLSRAPSLAHAAIMLLDGLQPTGATTLVLDQNQIAPALGGAAAINPLLAVQVLDSNSFLHLGTVISPVGKARYGAPILRLKLTYENGQETSVEVKHGSLQTLPLPYGQTARLHLQPLHRFDVGMGAPGRGGCVRITGGALGVIIDARGRPLTLPLDDTRRSELLQKWLFTLGGR